MKKIILLLFPIISLAQPPNKNGLDSVVLTNDLINWSKGTSTVRGSQNLKYYSVFKNYYSIGAATAANPNSGAYNIAIGDHAGDSISGGAHNIFLGRGVGQRNKTGNFNFAASWDALRDNISGNSNIAIVEDALRSNQRGSNNVALGNGAQFTNIAGNHNISIGNQSLYYLNRGVENVAIGGYTAVFLEKGDGNIFIGAYNGELNSAGVGRTINDMIGIGRYTGISKGFSRSISIGFDIQPEAENKINIGNVYKGDVSTGVAEVSSIVISGRQVRIDDNYIYVKTSTGEEKRVPLQSVVSTTKAIVENQNFVLYGTDGKLIGYFKMVQQ